MLTQQVSFVLSMPDCRCEETMKASPCRHGYCGSAARCRGACYDGSLTSNDRPLSGPLSPSGASPSGALHFFLCARREREHPHARGYSVFSAKNSREQKCVMRAFLLRCLFVFVSMVRGGDGRLVDIDRHTIFLNS